MLRMVPQRGAGGRIGQPGLDGADGLSKRTVRDTVHLLRDAGYLAIKTGHGPGKSNRYTLKYRQPAATFNEANSGSGLLHSDEEMRQLSV